MTVRSLHALITGALLALVIPAAAQAATRTVYLGEPPANTKTFEQQYHSDANDYFPRTVTIHKGDSVKFTPSGFHTVEIPAKGKAPAPIIVPGSAVSGHVDAAGAPFWFNGQPSLGFNPAIAMSNLFGGGKTKTYSGATGVQSGLPLSNHPKSFSVKFTKAGTFTYYCNLHAGMKGVVKVLSKSKHIPSSKAVAKTVKGQVAEDLAIAKSLASYKPPAGVVSVGAAGEYGVEYYDFAPKTLSVPAGTTIKFQMATKSFEAHTATTGPGDPATEPTSYLGKLAASLNSPSFAPEATYPSDVPGTPASLTPTFHGNGFWNSGFLAANLPPLPASNSVKFSAPGTYQFYCLIHPFMHGTITVT